MNKIRFLALAALTSLSLITSHAAQAASQTSGPFGLGIVLGEPTAITGKYDASAQTAYDFGVSFDINKWVLVYGDWHHKFPGAFGSSVEFFNELTPYVGVGALLVFSNDDAERTRRYDYFDENGSDTFALGVRVPLGIEWRTPRVPLGVFLEIVPGITVLPATDGFVQGGLGVRYYF